MVYVNYNFDLKKWKENKKSFILPFPEFIWPQNSFINAF